MAELYCLCLLARIQQPASSQATSVCPDRVCLSNSDPIFHHHPMITTVSMAPMTNGTNDCQIGY